VVPEPTNPAVGLMYDREGFNPRLSYEAPSGAYGR
jgi:hypothetical protein